MGLTKRVKPGRLIPRLASAETPAFGESPSAWMKMLRSGNFGKGLALKPANSIIFADETHL